MDNTKNDHLKSDDLLLYLEKYLIYLLPLNYLNHPFLCTNTDGSITKLNCESNNFLEIEDKLISECVDPKENEMVKSNCFLTIYTTLSDIKMNDDESSENKPSELSTEIPIKSNRDMPKSSSRTFFENSFMKDFFKDPKEMIKEAKDWINQFINFYIYVLNWVKYEKLFKKHPDINDRILARIMAFAYSILDNIANPDLNPAFQSFYLKENHQTRDEKDESKNKNKYSFMDQDQLSSSTSSSQSNIMDISSTGSNDDESTSTSTSHSNHYANSIPVLPSNKTSIINYYSPKLKNKILLITKLIRILSRYETSSQLIGKNRGITILLQIMKLFSDCIEIQIECSASMANLASISLNRVKMLEEGCINLILENMNKFISSSDVQAEICATLANLACHDANAKHIVENGGCDHILRAMVTHMDKTDLQIQAFHSLSSLCKYGKEEMEKDRFMQVIRTSILKHQNSVDLMVSACNALGLMALSGMRMTSCKATILVVILKALKRFEDHQIFQITAFFSLSHLLCIHDSNRDTVNSEIITKYKGVELILNAMKRFPYHISLQTTACFALESIIINHDNHRKEFLELNGIDIILNVMRFDFSLLKKRRSYFEDEKNEIVDTIDENENIDVSITLDLDSSSESLFYSKYKDNSFHSFSKELLLQLFGSVALLNASDNKQCKEIIIKKGCLHYIYLASKKVANCNDLWLVLYYVFTRFASNNENTDTKSMYMKPYGVPTLQELCSRKIINNYTQNTFKHNDLKNYDSQKTLIDNNSNMNLTGEGSSSSFNLAKSSHTINNNDSQNSNSVNSNINNSRNNNNSNNSNNNSNENVNLVLVDEVNHNVTIIPSENNDSSLSLSSSSSTISSISIANEDSSNHNIEEGINDLEIVEDDENNDEGEVEESNWFNNPLYNHTNNENQNMNIEQENENMNDSDDESENMNDSDDEDIDDINSDVEMDDANNEDDNDGNDSGSDDILKILVQNCPLINEIKTEKWKQNEEKYINSLPLSSNIQDYLLSHEYCWICGKACFESCIRLYSISRKKNCSLVYFCSKECAEKDIFFEKRVFYYVYPETAEKWWHEKQIEILKNKKLEYLKTKAVN